MATVQEVVEYNRKHVDWNKVFSVIDTVGTTMNGQKDRFDKSDLIEMSLSVFSNGAIEYTNADGCDHLLSNLLDANGAPTTQEMKFSSTMFYKNVNIRRANKKKGIESLFELRERSGDDTVTLVLLNSQGENTHTTLPQTYATFLLAVDNNSAFIVEVDALRQGGYIKRFGDSLQAKDVPISLFHKIVGSEDLTERVNKNVNYKEQKLAFQMQFLSMFK